MMEFLTNGMIDVIVLKTKRKTPKQYWTQPMKRKLDTAKICESEKKMFKEAFNTNKSLLENEAISITHRSKTVMTSPPALT